jgi:hypothetical protein
MAHLALIVARWIAVPMAGTRKAEEQHGSDRDNHKHTLYCSAWHP